MYVDSVTIVLLFCLLIKSYVFISFVTWWICKGRKEIRKVIKSLKKE